MLEADCVWPVPFPSWSSAGISAHHYRPHLFAGRNFLCGGFVLFGDDLPLGAGFPLAGT